MIDEKKCKGQGKAYGFESCGKMVLNVTRKHGLCMNCYPKWLTNDERGKILLYKAINQVQKPRLDLEKAENEMKQRSKLKQTHNHTKILVHAYVRERDKCKNCVSCDAPWNPDFQACHFYKAELFETLKYHLDNIHGGCKKCNLFLDGNHENYSVRLPNRIGEERYQNLVKLAEIDKKASKVWDIDSLLEIQLTIKNLNKCQQ